MSELIDRKIAVQGVKELFSMGDCYCDELSIVGMLNSLPTAETERKWIPATDRLPKDNRQVLVYAQSVHFALAKYDEMMEANGEWKKQWVTFDAWKPYYTIENVIAWMPLPEPWRGSNGNVV